MTLEGLRNRMEVNLAFPDRMHLYFHFSTKFHLHHILFRAFGRSDLIQYLQDKHQKQFVCYLFGTSSLQNHPSLNKNHILRKAEGLQSALKVRLGLRSEERRVGKECRS